MREPAPIGRGQARADCSRRHEIRFSHLDWELACMAEQTPDVPEQTASRRSDALYVLIAGLYVGVLATPAVMVALASSVTDAAGLYVGFLVALAALSGIAGLIVFRVPTIAVRLGRTDAVWFLVVLPFGWIVGVLGAPAVGIDPPTIAVLGAVVGTAGGMFLGIALVGMSRTRHAVAAVEDTTEHVVWEARWPERWRRLATGVLVVTFGLGMVGVAAVFALGREWGWSLYYVLFAGIPFMNLLNPRTFSATDAGLVVGNPVQRQFRPWSAFAGYDRTDDALVIRSTAWWRPAHRCDIGDIEEAEAVVSALETYLPTQDTLPT